MKKKIDLFRKLMGIQKITNQILDSGERLEYFLERNYRMEQEVLSALKFNSTIADSKWFSKKNISPGESAVNYAFFYTLFRVLSSVKPDNILEFGLGQSSKMVHQYAKFFGKNAITVEHDKEWVEFFLNEIKDDDYDVTIQMMGLETIEYKGGTALTYKDCLKAFNNQKFDLVIVDGPFGFAPETVYSRPQILDIIRGCISDVFVIIMDDYNREGEKNTIKEVFRYFEQNKVDFVFREYCSIKSHILITVPKLKFLTTL